MHKRTAALALLTGALFLAAGQCRAQDENAIRIQVEKLQQANTKPWRQVPWFASLLEARQLSKEQNRPLLIFSHDGNFDTGRC
jgi:hypothetical protein